MQIDPNNAEYINLPICANINLFIIRLQVTLRLGDDVPMEYQADFDRWKGEPVRAIIIPKKLFRQNGKGYPVLLRVGLKKV